MQRIEKINISDYNYPLPNEQIALQPYKNRDESQLLIYKNGSIYDSTFKDISTQFEKPVLFVRNNTKVIQARMFFSTQSSHVIEIFLLEPENESIEKALHRRATEATFRCMVGNKRKWSNGEVLELWKTCNGKRVRLQAEYIEGRGLEHIIAFRWAHELEVRELLECFGLTPLPPYIKRQTESYDKESYQTIYSDREGSVAAPTAGLHFTERLIEKLKNQGHNFCDLTLHVGAGTFQPIKGDNAAEHKMHGEEIHISLKSFNQIYHAVLNNIPIVAVGTTSLRSLETLFGWGVQVAYQKISMPHYFSLSQWEVYNYKNFERRDSLQALKEYITKAGVDQISGRTHLMIVPGHEFKLCDALITNFHQPKSTLLLLVSAFVGDDWKNIYKHALERRYRFLSYGDCSLLWLKAT